MEDALEEFWSANPRLGPMQRLIEAIRQVALPELEGRGPKGSGLLSEKREESTEESVTSTPHHLITSSPSLVIFVDEIDVVRSLPFSADEFFAGIRSCFNRRTQDPMFERLTFCLLGVATPADLITETRMSPFNIGRRILVTDFTPEEAAPLAAGLVSRQDAKTQSGENAGSHKGTKAQREKPRSNIKDQKLLARILYWTSGHPYMTQRLCRALFELTPLSHAGKGTGGEARRPILGLYQNAPSTPSAKPSSSRKPPGIRTTIWHLCATGCCAAKSISRPTGPLYQGAGRQARP